MSNEQQEYLCQQRLKSLTLVDRLVDSPPLPEALLRQFFTVPEFYLAVLENTRVGTQKLPRNSERINFVVDTTTRVKYRMFREYNERMDEAKVRQLRQTLQEHFYDLARHTQSNMVYKLMVPRRVQKNRFDVLSTQINTNVLSPGMFFRTYLRPILVSIEGEESVDRLRGALEVFKTCGP